MRRMQKGYCFRSDRWWYVRFIERRVETGKIVQRLIAKRLTRVLPQHKRLKRPPEYVEEMQAEFMAKVNTACAEPEKVLTLSEFVTDVFLPHIASRRKISTSYCHKLNWQKQLAPRVGQILVRDFATTDAQRALDSIARDNPDLSRQTLFRYKSLLSGILRHAINQGYCSAPNPVSSTEVPSAKPSRVMPVYLLEDVRTMLAILPEPARTVVAVAAFTGLRRGEIEGQQWQDFLAPKPLQCSTGEGRR